MVDHEPDKSGAAREDAAPSVPCLQLLGPQISSPSPAASPELHSSDVRPEVERLNAEAADSREVTCRDAENARELPEPAAVNLGPECEDSAWPDESSSTPVTPWNEEEGPFGIAERCNGRETRESEASSLSSPSESPLLATAERLLWAQIQNPGARLFRVSDLEQKEPSATEHADETQENTDERREASEDLSSGEKALTSPCVQAASYTSPR